jgi:hypothetical protein
MGWNENISGTFVECVSLPLSLISRMGHVGNLCNLCNEGQKCKNVQKWGHTYFS